MIVGNIFRDSGCKSNCEELNTLMAGLQIPDSKNWDLFAESWISKTVKSIPVILDEYLSKTPESHFVNADLHFIVDGSEKHLFWNIDSQNLTTEQYLEDDNCFYSDISALDASEILLTAGDFVIYWPGEIHLAGFGSTQVRKFVYKIKVIE